ncbi:FAD-binding protein [Methylotenera sp.]|uniref:electron transfer flavoprotein subunit alpha/FixB family protein n=1 Tax=Methylotenera sp. TaxID=2051956 RepID=UPI00248A4D1C|nr:FAD-binding protein [Methylotenera sp.]MDI1299357.1 FAD-binding protein [Methylotenera sp.]
MKILILAEHDGLQLSPSVRQAVTAAQFWNSPVHVLVAGHNADAVIQQAASIHGVERVIHANAAHLAHPLAEDIANLIVSISEGYEVILAAHSSFSKNALPRVAALLDVAMISDVLEIKAENTYVRSIYAGNVLTTIQSTDAVQLLTVHGSNFAAASLGANNEISSTVIASTEIVGSEIVSTETPAAFKKASWKSEVRSQSDRPALGSAKIVISGGRSLGSAESFEEVLSPLASKLGAALGATRAAVDAGFAPNDIQVGQTGVVVAPELYIAVGVSGAIQHTYGMKDSKIVVAINQDPDAPIFQVADYGLVADLFDVIPALTAAIR